MPNRQIQQLFDSLQEQLLVDLASSRAVTKHPTSKGSGSEAGWMNLFQHHLPYRYQADKAFVMDSHGQCSDEIDIVIYDRQYTPLLYNHQGQLFIPAESVYAVFEVKQELSKRWIKYAGTKAATVRNLRRTSGPIPHAGGRFKARRLFPILSGILCYQSSWHPPFGAPFVREVKNLNPTTQLDLGCAVKNGAFRVRYSKRKTPAVEAGVAAQSLPQFFFWFLERLQTLATVPAIQYSAYARFFPQRKN